jgi:hypothetical protein
LCHIFHPALQQCFVATLNATGQCVDLYSLTRVIWLIYLLNLQQRKAIAEVWRRGCDFLLGLGRLSIFQASGCLKASVLQGHPWLVVSGQFAMDMLGVLGQKSQVLYLLFFS